MRCQCMTLKNAQCKRDAMPDSTFCKQHKDCQKKMKQKMGNKKHKHLSKKIPIRTKKQKILSLNNRMKNIYPIINTIFEKDNPMTFEDTDVDDAENAHADYNGFSQYLAGRGYTPEELLATKKKWGDDYETSKDLGVRKLDQLRKDFIKDGKPEWIEGLRAGLGHTWSELGPGQPIMDVAEMIFDSDDEWYNDHDILFSLSNLPQYNPQ